MIHNLTNSDLGCSDNTQEFHNFLIDGQIDKYKEQYNTHIYLDIADQYICQVGGGGGYQEGEGYPLQLFGIQKSHTLFP